MVESVPPLKAPVLSIASYSGRSFRLAHFDWLLLVAEVAVSFEAMAVSSRWMVSWVTERRWAAAIERRMRCRCLRGAVPGSEARVVSGGGGVSKGVAGTNGRGDGGTSRRSGTMGNGGSSGRAHHCGGTDATGMERRRRCQSTQGRSRKGGVGSAAAEGDHNDAQMDHPPSAHGKRERARCPSASGSAEKGLPITGTDPFDSRLPRFLEAIRSGPALPDALGMRHQADGNAGCPPGFAYGITFTPRRPKSGAAARRWRSFE